MPVHKDLREHYRVLKAEVYEYHQKGFRPIEIAQMLGINKRQVNKWLEGLYIGPIVRGKNIHKFTDDNGYLWIDTHWLAEEIGLSQDRVSNLLARKKVPFQEFRFQLDEPGRVIRRYYRLADVYQKFPDWHQIILTKKELRQSIPDRVLYHPMPGLRHFQHILLCVLISWKNTHDYWPSPDRLLSIPLVGLLANHDTNNIQRSLRFLEAKGFLTIINENRHWGKGKTAFYRRYIIHQGPASLVTKEEVCNHCGKEASVKRDYYRPSLCQGESKDDHSDHQ